MSIGFDTTGGLFMVGYAGTDPAAADELIKRYHAGGIILFTRNIRDAAHAGEVCGCVARITEGVSVFPGNMALGAVGSETYARRAAEATASELASLGINVNFAPVLDISSDPRNPGVGARSFGSDPASVARLGAAAIEGMQANGVRATAKHFPGLGEALVDSHDELPVVHASADELEGRELVPFRAAIDSDVSFVMTAHCAFPSLDATRTPGTLSKPILSGVLRERMGFGGITITDCLEMLSIEKDFPAPRAALQAVGAGATMLLICHTREKQVAAMEALARAADCGEIPSGTVESATAIVSSVKKRLRFPEQSAARIEPERSLSEQIAVEAVTIVRNNGSLLPLRLDADEKLAVVVPAFDALTKVEETAQPHEVLLNELQRRHGRVLYQKIAVEPSEAETRGCLETAESADKLLILTYNLHMYASQARLVCALLESKKPAVVAAVRDPFDLALLPEAAASVATYCFRECSLKALVEVLFGEIEAKGKLPVSLDVPEE